MQSHSHDVLIRLRPDVPADMIERAAGWNADSVPSVAAAAASVVLLRDGQLGLETTSYIGTHECLSHLPWLCFRVVG